MPCLSQAPRKSLYESTMELLDADPRDTFTLAKESDLHFHWLRSIRERRSRDPRVHMLQRLHDFLANSAPAKA